MRLKHCNSYGCRQKLLTVEEVKNRICEPHRSNLEDENYYVGICWSCGAITLVEDRQWDLKKREFFIRAKTIFSIGCELCTGDEEDNIRWINIPIELGTHAIAEITDQTDRLIISYQPSISNS